jgi:hypothetical protein
MRHVVFAFAVLCVIAIATPVRAHETRPFYLEINEIAPDRYNLTWRIPLYYGRRLPVYLRLPEDVRNIADPVERVFPDSIVERRVIDAGPDGLGGKRIHFDGLKAQVITDVLVRANLVDGTQWTVMAKPSQPWIEFKQSMNGFEAAKAYLTLGIQHILFGIDHLLFVFGLLLLSRGVWLLLKTITSFTVGHSISLALATLGFVNIPAKPLSAAIALSIVFLAAELVRQRRDEQSLTIRNPWIVSFGFGMLHGLGFATALVQLGLPRSDIPMALLLFNVGVEIGQVLFIIVALALFAALRRLEIKLSKWAEAIPIYAIGSIAGFWFIGRFLSLLGG